MSPLGFHKMRYRNLHLRLYTRLEQRYEPLAGILAVKYWKLIDRFAGAHTAGLDYESTFVFQDWLRDQGEDELADRIDEDSALRDDLIDKSIPNINEISEADFPHRKQLGMNRFGCVYPEIMGSGKLCVGPMNCLLGFDDWYQYESYAMAIAALESWNGNGMPTLDGMVRRSGPGQTIIRYGSDE